MNLWSRRNWDVYLIPPKGRRLRSTVELMKYIMAHPDVPIDARYIATSIFVVHLSLNFYFFATITTQKNLNYLKFSGDLKSGLVDFEWLKRGWVEYGTDFK